MPRTTRPNPFSLVIKERYDLHTNKKRRKAAIQKACPELNNIELLKTQDGQDYFLCDLKQETESLDSKANTFRVGNHKICLESSHYSVYSTVELIDEEDSFLHYTGSFFDIQTPTKRFTLHIYFNERYEIIGEPKLTSDDGIVLEFDKAELWKFRALAILNLTPFLNYIQPDKFLASLQSEYLELKLDIDRCLFENNLDMTANLEKLTKTILTLEKLLLFKDTPLYRNDLYYLKKQAAGIQKIQEKLLTQSIASANVPHDISTTLQPSQTKEQAIDIETTPQKTLSSIDILPAESDIINDDVAFQEAYNAVLSLESSRDLSAEKTLEDALAYDQKIAQLLEQRIFLSEHVISRQAIQAQLKTIDAMVQRKNEFCTTLLKRLLLTNDLEAATSLKHFCEYIDNTTLLLFIKKNNLKTLEFVLGHGQIDVHHRLLTIREKDGNQKQLSLLSAAYQLAKPDIFKLLLEKFQARILNADIDGFPLASKILFSTTDTNAIYKKYILDHAIECCSQGLFYTRLYKIMINYKRSASTYQPIIDDKDIEKCLKFSQCENQTKISFSGIRKQQMRDLLEKYPLGISKSVIQNLENNEKFLAYVADYQKIQNDQINRKKRSHQKINSITSNQDISQFIENPITTFIARKGTCTADDIVFLFEKLIIITEKVLELDELYNDRHKLFSKKGVHAQNILMESIVENYNSIMKPEMSALSSQAKNMSSTLKGLHGSLNDIITRLDQIKEGGTPKDCSKQLHEIKTLCHEISSLVEGVHVREAQTIADYNAATSAEKQIPLMSKNSAIDDEDEEQARKGLYI